MADKLVNEEESIDRIVVRGFTENLKDGSVQIVCEAEERVLEDFVKYSASPIRFTKVTRGF